METLRVVQFRCCSVPRECSRPPSTDWQYVPDFPLPPTDERFPEIWALADPIPGWLTAAQAELLFEQAGALPAGATALEIGSHQGRSTVVLAHAVRPRGGRVVAMDPFVDGRLFGGSATRLEFERHVQEAGVEDVVELVCEYSTKARKSWTRSFDLLYIDGKHDYWTLSDDLRWRVHLPAGAPVLVHDCFSSIGVTLGVLAHVLLAGDLRYERRAGSLALFRVGRPSGRDRLRIVAELPWWLRNVVVKVLLRLRLRSVARLLGHDSPYDPY
ncbi:class I SAM-dependent methyltransferase [Blastococcus brunescens]|uniref:Class I SAM-dependent methyltransferase n=1 Tax=Blastococcus brunescens TaxID=1564165 RepID=A0ABZ1BA15_9ACTN|nr:class I SAM-dependent methyltransferase [Blastococcus sp. BMG 8361]WRL67026.1 class I SAM-dependent methyltransferase [Blastococcus sp. BMG 8361]